MYIGIQVNTKYSAGKIPEAVEASHLAKKFNIAAVMTGTVMWIVFGM